MKSLRRLLILLTFSALSQNALASGSGSYGGGSFGSNSFPDQKRKIDENYEYGKAVFKGRIDGVAKYDYCLDIDGEKLPLKRKNIRNFKSSSYQEFANALYDCNAPDKKIGHEISTENFQYVLYYLNKRFRLKLDDLAGG